MNTVTIWKCEVCGYVHKGPEPPVQCPICGVGQEMFSPLAALDEPDERSSVDQWRCSVCDFVHSGQERPAVCPVCSAKRELFEPVQREVMTEAAAPAGPIVIVGAGVAGLTAAERARARAPEAEITLVSREEQQPYYRLNLTRFLAGEVGRSELTMHAPAWFDEQRLQIIQGEVTSLDLTARAVFLRDGRRLYFGRLVLATGSHPFVPPFTGATRRGVHVLRTIDDAQEILAQLRPGTRCLCIGGGLLGLETAGALRRRGAEVAIVESYGWLLSRQLPEPAGRALAQYIEQLGIQIWHRAAVEELAGDESVQAVRLRDGRELPAEIVVICTGVRPNSYLARQAQLTVGHGVIVDDQMRTSDSDVFACGDVAEHRGEVHGIWPVAYAQGAVAGTNAAGGSDEYRGVPRSNRLKVMEVDLFSIGLVHTTDGSYQVYEEDQGGAYKRLVSRDGRLVGAVLYGDTELAGLVKEAVEHNYQLPEAPALVGALPDWASFVEIERGERVSAKIKRAKESSMPSVKGTKTEQNLLKAFAGESQARNRYTYAAKVARKAGFVQIAGIFQETADNEREHAKIFFKFLEGGALEITASYPAGIIDDTAGNLEAAATGEHEEWTELYPAFAAVAKEEGFSQVAAAFQMIAKVEKEHEERYRKLLERVKADTVYKRDQAVRWKCDNCGYVHDGSEPPEKCPACQHAKNHFEVKAENY